MAKKKKYIIVQEGDTIRVADYVPEELAKEEFLGSVWIIRVSDLHFWYLGEWMPLKDYITIQKLF